MRVLLAGGRGSGSRGLSTRADRGSVVVEAALLLPVFLVLVFGVVEWSLVMRDEVAVSSAVRTGVRVASIPASVTATNITQPTADAIRKAGSVMPKDNIDYILVYQANNKGYPLPDGNTAMTCANAGSTCVKHTWNDVTNKFDTTAGTWDPALLNTCAGDPNAQSVGVYLKASHPMLTRFFGSTRSIDDRAVLRFEPRPRSVCKTY